MQVRLIGRKRRVRSLRRISRNVPKDLLDEQRDLIQQLRNRMKARIRGWGTSGRGNDLIRRLLVSGPYTRGQGRYNIGLRSTAPYSGFLEYGTDPRFLDASTKPKLLNWANNHIDTWTTSEGRIWVPVGGVLGTLTYVEKGNSQRQFFFNTIDEFDMDQRIVDNAGTAINKTLERNTR